jgi:hypothetical protein
MYTSSITYKIVRKIAQSIDSWAFMPSNVARRALNHFYDLRYERAQTGPARELHPCNAKQAPRAGRHPYKLLLEREEVGLWTALEEGLSEAFGR